MMKTRTITFILLSGNHIEEIFKIDNFFLVTLFCFFICPKKLKTNTNFTVRYQLDRTTFGEAFIEGWGQCIPDSLGIIYAMHRKDPRNAGKFLWGVKQPQKCPPRLPPLSPVFWRFWHAIGMPSSARTSNPHSNWISTPSTSPCLPCLLYSNTFNTYKHKSGLCLYSYVKNGHILHAYQ